jgi:hypothetical protein
MSDNKRKCAQCGLEVDPVSGLCAYCESEEVRELGKKRRQEVREKIERERRESTIRGILTGPPTLDELAAAAVVCERLAMHIDKTSGDSRALILRSAIEILKIAIDFS